MATPKIIPYTVKLRSVVPEKTFSKPPVVYTNDLRSAEFQFKITDMDASELLTATAKTMLYMRDGSFFQNPSTDVSRVGNVFSYLLKENEGNHAGIAKIQLVVYFNEGLANEQNFPTQLYEFEIINGLETKVAQEVMIYDWTTLTRDARAYIDQFVADEMLRDAEFDNAQFDRNAAFEAAQDARTLAFGTEQTNRGTAFTAEQNERTAEFNESESDRTTAETGRVTAEEGRVTSENDRVTKEGQRVTAESNRVTAEGNRVTAESGRVTAENARATTFSGYDARITGMETDVNANATNLVTNGDFSSGLNGWTPVGASAVVEADSIAITSDNTNYPRIYSDIPQTTLGDKYYVRASYFISDKTNVKTISISAPVHLYFYGIATIPNASLTVNAWADISAVGSIAQVGTSVALRAELYSSTVATTLKFKKPIAINLTATFGKGNEPTTEQMDAILAMFPNSWFDGTKNLFRASETLKKQIAIDARTEFDALNLSNGGDFAADSNVDGVADYWSKMGPVTISYDSVEKAQVLNSAYTNVALENVVKRQIVLNHKYAHVFKLKKTTSESSTLRVGLGASSSNIILNVASVTDSEYTTESYTQIVKVVTVSTLPVNYASSALFSGNGGTNCNAKIKDYLLVNLTETFGAGKEPTQDEFKRLMARFPNSWFDGVKPIQTIETLYQEKANKVQEAWITPTLLNGWTNYGTDIIKMYKDEFGIVHIRGRIRGGTGLSALITLPVGYRPAQGKYAANVASIGAILTSTKKLFMVAAQSGTDNRIFIFDGAAADWTHAESFLAIDISYRAEV